MLRHIICALLFSVLVTAAWAANTPDKKFIEYGWDVPNTAFVRENVREMEKLPFDGVVIRVENTRPGMFHRDAGWCVFSKEKLLPTDFDQAIEDLKATRFERLTDNFIQVISMPGDVDWFDPEWTIVAENAACLARVAKQGGCVGIMFDPEMYAEHKFWGYKGMPEEWQKAHSYKEAAAKVKERGRQFMTAINRKYPGITILCLFGPSLPYLWGKDDLKACDYGFLMPFYNGMCEAADDGTVIVDGYEFSYGYRRPEQFIKAWYTMVKDCQALADNPAEYDEHIRPGFGVWTDYDPRGIGWHLDDFSKNYFTPEGLRASLAYARSFTHKYVWVYSEFLLWWTNEKCPPEYVEALALARKGPGPGQNRWISPPSPLAANMAGYSDDETFAKMRETMTEIFDLPKDGWKWARASVGSGDEPGCDRAAFDDSAWRDISIGQFWEEQGEDYDGEAWYRLKFTAPSVDAQKRVFLAFGAADEHALIWLNDRYVGEGNVGWDRPFAVDVTEAVRPGQENVLAVWVKDTVGAGGLWKSVKLMVK